MIAHINDEFTVHLADHEVLLSFVNDEDAYRFRDWWYEDGHILFEKSVEDEEE